MAHRPLAGIALLLTAVACFASMDTLVRGATSFAPGVLILWLRYGLQAVAVSLGLAILRPRELRTRQPKFQLVRGLLLVATSGITVWGLKSLPVAEFTAVFMISPMIVTLASVWLFKESVRPVQWVLLTGIFAGMLLIVRPGGALFVPAIGWPLLGALVYSAFQLLTRTMALRESAFTTHLYTGLTASVVLTPLLWTMPDGLAGAVSNLAAAEWLWLGAIAVLGTVSHLLLVLAFARAPASTLMPFVYTQIGFATLAGWAAYGHAPDGPSLIGMVIIAGCGAGVMWLNRAGGRLATSAVNE